MAPMAAVSTISSRQPTGPSTLPRDQVFIDCQPVKPHGRSSTPIYRPVGSGCRWPHITIPFTSFPLIKYSLQPIRARHGRYAAPAPQDTPLDSSSWRKHTHVLSSISPFKIQAFSAPQMQAHTGTFWQMDWEIKVFIQSLQLEIHCLQAQAAESTTLIQIFGNDCRPAHRNPSTG